MMSSSSLSRNGLFPVLGTLLSIFSISAALAAEGAPKSAVAASSVSIKSAAAISAATVSIKSVSAVPVGKSSFANISVAALGGTSSGGGFFRNSPALLKASIDNDVALLQNLSDGVLSAIMPDSWKAGGWSKDRLIKVLENTCSEPGEFRKRDNQPLVFDFCSGDPSSSGCQTKTCQANAVDGQYISALFPFFSAYENVPPGSTEYQQSIENVSVALLHEAVHLLGVGISNDEDAQTLANEIAIFSQGSVWPAQACTTFPKLCSSINQNHLIADLGWKGGGYRDVLMATTSSIQLTLHTSKKSDAIDPSVNCGDLGAVGFTLYDASASALPDGTMPVIDSENGVKLADGFAVEMQLASSVQGHTYGLLVSPSVGQKVGENCSFSIDLTNDHGTTVNLKYYDMSTVSNQNQPNGLISLIHPN
jgi:hypothetical protein